MVVIARIDLDRYNSDQLMQLVKDEIITMSEACEAECIKAKSDVDRLMWVREVKGEDVSDLKRRVSER